MLSPYRSLLSLPGAPRFVASAFLARLGGAMFGVSTIVMVAELRHSYALAGLLSAVSLVAMAAGGPVVARLVDARGQAAVALPATAVVAGTLTAFVVACRLGAPAWLLAVLSLGNAVMPQVGTLSRARWAHLLRADAERLHVANSFEQVSEEICFMAGPAVGAALGAALVPEAGFLLAIVLFVAGAVGLLTQRSTEPPVAQRHEAHTGGAVRMPGLLLVALGLLLTGSVFGAMDVTVIAFTDERGLRTWGGLTLGMFALGSAVGGLAYGARPAPGLVSRRLVWCHLAMLVLLVPVLLVGSVPVLGVLLLVAGTAIAPTLITGTMLAQRLVPPSQINEGMTIVLTGLLLGVSAGSYAAGQVIESRDAHTAFLVPLGAAALAAGAAALGRRRVVAAEEQATRRWGTPTD